MKSKAQTIGDIWTYIRAVGDSGTFTRSMLNEAVCGMKGEHSITTDYMIAAAKATGSISYNHVTRVWVLSDDGPILRHIKETGMQSNISQDAQVLTSREIVQIYQEYIELGGYQIEDAIDAVVHTTHLPRKTIVAAILDVAET
jgi:hypothetical protein